MPPIIDSREDIELHKTHINNLQSEINCDLCWMEVPFTKEELNSEDLDNLDNENIMNGKLNFVVFEDPDHTGLKSGENRWIARGLFYDFIGEGSCATEAVRNFFLSINAEFEFARIDERQPFEDLPQTPSKFINWINLAKKLIVVKLQLEKF